MSDARTPEEIAWFWDLLDSAQRNLQTLCRKLEALPQDELVNYQRLCWYAKEDINPFTRFEEMPPLRTPVSEDQGDDFSAWVLGEGRAFFETVRDNPADIQKFMDSFEDADSPKWNEDVDQKEYRGNQRLDFIARPIYRKRFSEELDEAVEAALDNDFGN